MKQYKIIAAYNAAEKLSEYGITEKEQWEIYQLRRMLRSHKEFQKEREDEIRKRYLPYADENGNLDSEKSKEVISEFEKINNLDIELENFSKPSIKIVQGVTCRIMEDLEDFIEFIPPD